MSLSTRLNILKKNNYIPLVGNWIKTNLIAKNAYAGLPLGIDQLSNTNLIIADYTFNLIWEINKSGKLNVIAGTGMQGYSGDNELAINAELNGPHDLVVDNNDNIYFSDLGNQVYRMIDYKTKIITTIAGNGILGRHGDGELAINAEMENGVLKIIIPKTEKVEPRQSTINWLTDKKKSPGNGSGGFYRT